jgi:hypothetical protein
MKALKGTPAGRDLMTRVRSHKKPKGNTVNFTSSERKKLAASGAAMADGSYPIRNQQDLENAYKDWIRTGRSSQVAAHIAKRAKQLGLANPISKSSGSTSEMDVARAYKNRNR